VTPEDEIPLAGGGLAAPGPAFITKAVNGFPWGGDDPTLADGILDRLVHNAHRIEMRGDSMRKNRGKPNVK
jgi:hypothetical protein